jgi:SAM-dependent MidA family methyltransferase
MPEPGPDASDGALDARIRARIREHGPIGFDAFMEAALYDPDGGYYAGAPIVGERGDFVTSPHVSPAFGVLLARCVEDLWHRLERPDPFLLVEVGAGDGTLAARLIASLPAELAAATTFVAVERGRGSRAALERVAGAWTARTRVTASVDGVTDVAEVPAAGVVLANELLDNVPFRRIRGGAAGPEELMVGLDGDRLVLVELPASADLLALTGEPVAGREVTVSPAALDLVERTIGLLGDGYVLLIDYAAEAAGSVQVHGYRRHRVEADVFDAPGTRDITVGVDMAAVAERAARCGATVWGPLSQRRALLNLGFAAWDTVLQHRQTDALGAGRGREAAAIFSARNQARMLIDGAGLGGFDVLCVGVGRATRPELLLDGEPSRPGRATGATPPVGAAW